MKVSNKPSKQPDPYAWIDEPFTETEMSTVEHIQLDTSTRETPINPHWNWSSNNNMQEFTVHSRLLNVVLKESLRGALQGFYKGVQIKFDQLRDERDIELDDAYKQGLIQSSRYQ